MINYLFSISNSFLIFLKNSDNAFLSRSFKIFSFLLASSISDICSNSLRVIKTNRQTSASSVSYVKLVKNIVENDSLLSLFTRGLKTKIITNGIQGMCFTVMFDYLRKN